MNKNALSLLKKDIKLTLEQYPGLTVSYHRDIPVKLSGEYNIIDGLGDVLETYSIEVLISPKYPNEFPILIEKSEKIPRHIDRHISKDGVACVELIHKENVIACGGISVFDFFGRYVNKYFCWQLLYEIDEERSKLDEWPHDSTAALRFYSELLKTSDVNVINAVIIAAVSDITPALNRPCVCGSTKKYKRCHMNEFPAIRAIGKKQLYKDLNSVALRA